MEHTRRRRGFFATAVLLQDEEQPSKQDAGGTNSGNHGPQFYADRRRIHDGRQHSRKILWSLVILSLSIVGLYTAIYYVSSRESYPHTASFLPKPRSLQLLQDLTVLPLNPVVEAPPSSGRKVTPLGRQTTNARRREKGYSPLPGLPEGCQPLADWQSSHNPSCLKFHEIDLKEEDTDDIILTKYINSGEFRDVFMFREFDGTRRALKSLAFWNENSYQPRITEMHRKDAVAFEQLSASPHVADIFGYCSSSALFDFADGSDLYQLFYWRGSLPSKEDRLIIARDAAAALADFHHVDSKGRATMAHTDIRPDQFILLDGRYKLNDFNLVRFLAWNTERNEECGFKFSGPAPGMWRSPEEYREEVKNEKVDVWSLGHVFFSLLKGEEPYPELSSERRVREHVLAGGISKVTDDSILQSNHTFDKRMLRAMEMCYVHDVKKRATSREVADYLEDAVRLMHAN